MASVSSLQFLNIFFGSFSFIPYAFNFIRMDDSTYSKDTPNCCTSHRHHVANLPAEQRNRLLYPYRLALANPYEAGEN